MLWIKMVFLWFFSVNVKKNREILKIQIEQNLLLFFKLSWSNLTALPHEMYQICVAFSILG